MGERPIKVPNISNSRGRCRVRFIDRGVAFSRTLDIPYTDEGIAEAVRVRDEMLGPGLAALRAGTEKDAGTLHESYQNAFKQARRRPNYQLSKANEEMLVVRAAGRCELSGVEFSARRFGFHRRPYAPSVDRIDSGQGYTASNTRLVVIAVNLALNEWGDLVFDRIATGYAGRKLLEESNRNPHQAAPDSSEERENAA